MNTYWEYCEALWDVCLSVFVFTKKKKFKKYLFIFPLENMVHRNLRNPQRKKLNLSSFFCNSRDSCFHSSLSSLQSFHLLLLILHSFGSCLFQFTEIFFYILFKIINSGKCIIIFSLKTKTMVCQGINLYVAKGLQIKFFSKKLIKFI